MKCPHCGQEHPDGYKFCPLTSKSLTPQLKACTNERCEEFGKYTLPLDAIFCPCCGELIGTLGEETHSREYFVKINEVMGKFRSILNTLSEEQLEKLYEETITSGEDALKTEEIQNGIRIGETEYVQVSQSNNISEKRYSWQTDSYFRQLEKDREQREQLLKKKEEEKQKRERELQIARFREKDLDNTKSENGLVSITCKKCGYVNQVKKTKVKYRCHMCGREWYL